MHNGSVPTLHALLDSSTRPGRFTRPPSTDFEHYDTTHVGWKFTEVSAEELASTARRSPFQAKFIVDTGRFGMGNGGHTFGDDLSEARADGSDRVPEDAVRLSGQLGAFGHSERDGVATHSL